MTWIGDSVNHSARLMGKAAKTNRIFADKASVDAAATEIAFENIGQIALKGKGLVQSYVVNGLKFKGSVLTDRLNETSDMSSPPQMFDNMASFHSSILLDWAISVSKLFGTNGTNGTKDTRDINGTNGTESTIGNNGNKLAGEDQW
jgi:hypothetical protein